MKHSHKKRYNKKGETVVETVVAFVIMALAFTVGMIGIATGANFVNSGARLKQSRSDLDTQITSNATTAEVSVTGDNIMAGATGTVSYTVTEYSYEGFKTYESGSTTP